MISTGNVLVLMPCSGNKLPHADQPRRLYLGPMWQTLRTHRGELSWRNVIALSGKYGIICAQTFIQTYDDRLSRAKADYLIGRGIHAPNDHFGTIAGGGAGCSAIDTIVRPGHRGRPPFELVISAGAGEYRRVFESFIPQLQAAGLVAPQAEILQVAGGIGEQRGQLGKWLRKINGADELEPITRAA